MGQLHLAISIGDKDLTIEIQIGIEEIRVNHSTLFPNPLFDSTALFKEPFLSLGCSGWHPMLLPVGLQSAFLLASRYKFMDRISTTKASPAEKTERHGETR